MASAHAPTLELRVCDACPLVDDAVLIAGLFRGLARAAELDIEAGRPYAAPPAPLHRAGIWQAARSGLSGGVSRVGRLRRLPFRPPLWPDSLFGHLAATGVPGVEEWRDGAYRRTLRMPHGTGIVLRGCLDELSDPEVDALLPESGADTLYTRLRGERDVKISKAAVIERANG